MRKLSISMLIPVLLFVAPTFVFGQPSFGQPSMPPKPGVGSGQPPGPMPGAPRPGAVQPGTPMGSPNQPKATEAPAKSKLEQMLEIALKNNPDIKVAQAKALEADTVLNRTRLAVTQKVVLLNNKLETARANVTMAEKVAKRFRALSGSGGVAAQELDEAEAKLVQAKAELAKVEAEVPYLLGQQKLTWQKDADGHLHLVVEAAADEKYQDVLARIEAARLLQGAGSEMRLEVRDPNSPMDDKIRAATVNKSMSEKLHAALEKTIEFKQDGMTVKDLFDLLQESGKFDIPVITKDGTGDMTPANTSFKSVSLGALLQWLEDELPEHCFVVRDYGLVLMKRESVPPGAVLLDDFRKEAAKAKEEKK